MATHTWTQTPQTLRIAVPSSTFETEPQTLLEQPSWVEKYRAALLEIDRQARLERIFEADAILRRDAGRLLDPRERDAIDQARQILTLLREGLEGCAGHTSWLL